jgi:WASH complex subunit strumpellin
MREICDKHFPDNWVIPIYGGELADISMYWASFNAANKALCNNIVLDRVKYFATIHADEVQKADKKINKYIIEGQLQEKEALDNVKILANLLRDANSTIRWIMLHQNCTSKSFRQEISQIIDRNKLVELILNVAKFETLFKDMLVRIVSKKS